MNERDYEQLTLFQGDSLASLSVQPGSVGAQKMTVTSGLNCLELYKKSGPLGSLVRTLLESSLWHSTRCFLTWKISATPRKRLLFRLAPSMPRTDGTGARLWPTVRSKETGGLSIQPGQARPPGSNTDGSGKNVAYAKSKGLARGKREGKSAKPGFECCGENVSNTESAELPGQRRATRGGRPEPGCGSWWPVEPGVGRVANGVPNRVDRIKCLGNAVVPAQFYPIFKAIADIERSERRTSNA